VSASATRVRLGVLSGRLRQPGTGQAVARTAGFNVALLGALGLGGVILARTVGPAVRGEYAAITAWLDVALIIGQFGQPAALCFYVASDPRNARQYVATSRTIMAGTGVLVLTAGLLLAPVLAHGNHAVTAGYRIAAAAAAIAFLGTSYVSSLQPRDMHRWNVVRVSQPLLSLVALAGLWSLRLLTLHSALTVLAVTWSLQLAWAYRCCRVSGLAPGRSEAAVARPLVTYGVTQLAALAPTTLNAQLGQLVLSQTARPADLGRYAVAVSLTLLPMPVVSAIGNVAFPRLAARSAVTAETHRRQARAVVASAGLAAGMLLPVGAAAPWAIPLILGPGYRGAVPLLWVLMPGAVCSACGQVAGDVLRGGNRLAAVARAQGPAAVILVALLLVLLPVAGVMGAAIASTVSYAIALAMMLRSLRRRPDGPARRP
jgi:O-antigen/teichoic acid export membrane protein